MALEKETIAIIVIPAASNGRNINGAGGIGKAY